ncbi:YbfB/YjiJ family MFS transporter [Microvirga flavescens]|uniref:YbfB/YjiJ family MFS transporter n=1 Tax=Microvirga flavescens TaxID=2249811 RepID=UPI0018E0B105|nr:YbfB/YjiJ family MFS transporter [Microvirga flavescens]
MNAEAMRHGAPAGSITPLRIAVAGMASLAVAMGIGRFAFTPLLPMMLNDQVIDLPSGSWLATANYIGYLLGALICTVQPRIWARYPALPTIPASAFVRIGLVLTVLLTAGMAAPVPALWPILRFLSGVVSAVVFVFTSSWCMARLAKVNASPLGGLIFVGPGAGIASSGLLASGMVALHWSAASGWLVFGLLALLLIFLVWTTFASGGDPRPTVRTETPAIGTSRTTLEIPLLTFAYGLAGFGYIITATFLPVIAREALPPSFWLDMFWPIFGLGVMSGALLVTRIPARYDYRYLLTGCYVLQAAGILLSLWLPSLTGFALGSFLLGLPFTAITFFALHEVRRLRPAHAASLTGLLTAVYGIGQIAGPPLTAFLLDHAVSRATGFSLALSIAALTLVGGAVIYLGLTRAYPLSRATA